MCIICSENTLFNIFLQYNCGDKLQCVKKWESNWKKSYMWVCNLPALALSSKNFDCDYYEHNNNVKEWIENIDKAKIWLYNSKNLIPNYSSINNDDYNCENEKCIIEWLPDIELWINNLKSLTHPSEKLKNNL